MTQTNPTPEQFINAGKDSLEAFVALSQKSFEGVEKLVELQMQAVRATMAESADSIKALLSAKDAQEFIALQTSLVQPNAEKAASYGRHIYDITSSTQAEITKLIEAQVAAAQGKLVDLVDTAVKNAPAGTEGAAALLKSTLAAATNAVETAQKAAKQAVTVAEANFESMSQTATKAASAATPKAARRATSA